MQLILRREPRYEINRIEQKIRMFFNSRHTFHNIEADC